MFRRVVPFLFLMGSVGLTGCDQAHDLLGGKTPEPSSAPAVKADNPPPKHEPAPAESSGKGDQTAEDAVPAEQVNQAAQDKPAPALAPIDLSGQGDEVSEKFKLESGLSTWQIIHDGRSNVQMELLNQDGKEVDMPLNEIGAFNGTLVMRVAKAGEYLLNVKADGKWAVMIRQPRPDSGVSRPVAKQGKGPDVACFVDLPKGLSVFKVTHGGDGVFRVKLFDRDGKLVEQPFAQIGRYKGSKAVTLDQEGTYAVGVYANGDWSLKIE